MRYTNDTTLRPIQFKLRTLLLIVAVVAVLIGTTRFFFAVRVPPELVAQIEEGMSKQQVEGLIGAPDDRQSLADGEESWMYSSDNLGRSIYRFEFDRSGVVKQKRRIRLWKFFAGD